MFYAQFHLLACTDSWLQARQYLPKDFFYTSIQLNLNYAAVSINQNQSHYPAGTCSVLGASILMIMRAILMTSHRGKALHTDNNNMGKSFIMGIGNYSGGQLYVETRGNVLLLS